MVRMAPHRGGVARRGIVTEKLRIESQRQSKAKKCPATAKLGIDMLSNGKAQRK